MTFRITATITRVENGWSCSRGLPTFEVQAISQEEATLRAQDILEGRDDRKLSVSVVEV